MARRLLGQFGSIAAIIGAPDEDIRRAELDGETWAEKLLAAKKLVACGMFDNVVRTSFDATIAPLFEYLLHTLGGLKQERLLAFFLDNRGMVLAERTMAEGGEGEVAVPIRLIVGQALALGAESVVLAHNHPSGSAEPSDADVRNTQHLAKAMRSLRLKLKDHLIVGSGQVSSLRHRGQI